MANGERLDLDAYRRAITGEGARIGFVDLTFSASKAISVAWAMAKTPEEQALEEAEAAWFSYTHFTARPAVETVLTDAEGHGYTAFHEVPGQRADPQIHVHNPLLNHLQQRDGRISAVDLNRLQGLLLVGGAVFQAYTARYLREAGHTVTRGEHGDAQIAGVERDLQRQFSKRHEQAEAAARELAAKQGKDWETLKRDGQQIEFLARTTAEYRRDKVETALASPEAWQAEALARVLRCRNACAACRSLN
jgi:conjugative relaxase-like TrwC/TraI family protein